MLPQLVQARNMLDASISFRLTGWLCLLADSRTVGCRHSLAAAAASTPERDAGWSTGRCDTQCWRRGCGQSKAHCTRASRYAGTWQSSNRQCTVSQALKGCHPLVARWYVDAVHIHLKMLSAGLQTCMLVSPRDPLTTCLLKSTPMYQYILSQQLAS